MRDKSFLTIRLELRINKYRVTEKVDCQKAFIQDLINYWILAMGMCMIRYILSQYLEWMIYLGEHPLMTSHDIWLFLTYLCPILSYLEKPMYLVNDVPFWLTYHLPKVFFRKSINHDVSQFFFVFKCRFILGLHPVTSGNGNVLESVWLFFKWE